ncbi:MAG: tripartite tricarboxylate transporter substrate binding protein [Mameliella sp.]|nr:tripartite tricarboxylate transporter substrate binding protein [Mameliella sp.]
MKATAAATLMLALGTGAALAEYPERTIEMIVAYGAGGGTDIAARTLVPFVEKHLGNDASIAVINTPGAAGEIGFTKLAQSEPDGYTIGFINNPNLITIPIQRKARYSLDDIQPIGNVVYDANAFVSRADGEFSDLAAVVAFAKENPRKVTFGTTGIGGDDHLAMANFARLAGIELVHVPFQDTPSLRTAILGGHVQLAGLNISEVIDDVDEGSLIALGQMTDQPWELATDVPTFVGQGYDLTMGSQRGVAAPAGIPADVLAKLEEAIEKAIADPEFRAAAEKQRLPLQFIDSASFIEGMKRQDSDLRQIWNEEPWIK